MMLDSIMNFHQLLRAPLDVYADLVSNYFFGGYTNFNRPYWYYLDFQKNDV
jgi:hypothetical protein